MTTHNSTSAGVPCPIIVSKLSGVRSTTLEAAALDIKAAAKREEKESNMVVGKQETMETGSGVHRTDVEASNFAWSSPCSLVAGLHAFLLPISAGFHPYTQQTRVFHKYGTSNWRRRPFTTSSELLPGIITGQRRDQTHVEHRYRYGSQLSANFSYHL